MQDLTQIVCRSVVFFFVVALIAVNARPSHLGESSQILADQDSNQIYDLGLKPWQIQLLAQRLEEQNQPGNDYPFERFVRGDAERKRRYRPNNCFFNPVSCFKKK